MSIHHLRKVHSPIITLRLFLSLELSKFGFRRFELLCTALKELLVLFNCMLAFLFCKTMVGLLRFRQLFNLLAVSFVQRLQLLDLLRLIRSPFTSSLYFII